MPHDLRREYRLILQSWAEGVGRDLFASQRCEDAGHRFRCARIDANNAGMGMRTAQHLCMNHVREGDVVNVLRLTEAVESSIRPCRALAYGSRAPSGLGLRELQRINNGFIDRLYQWLLGRRL
jgi:hypothetical protein